MFKYLHLFLMSALALFPVINPIASALIVNPFFGNIDQKTRKKMVMKITVYCFFVCLVGLIGGKYILELFGLGVPVIKVMGGLILAKVGWDSLQGNNNKDGGAYTGNVAGMLFYPITFPITTGGGVLAILFTLSAHVDDSSIWDYLFSIAMLVLAAAVNCALVYILFLKSSIIDKINIQYQTILNKLIAFIVLSVGAQITLNGILLIKW